jgi:acyl-coenzyme A thioesterase PaaI-like protein
LQWGPGPLIFRYTVLMLDTITQLIPDHLKHTLQIRGMSLKNIPLLFFTAPSVVEVTSQRAEIRIPLNWRTKNHLGSMYFGALSIGADCAGGLIAWNQIQNSGERIDLIFKDFQAEFLKRAEGDVHFSCEQGEAIRDLIAKAVLSGERESLPVHVTARVPSKLGHEPVAKFVLTLSVKKSQKRAD